MVFFVIILFGNERLSFGGFWFWGLFLGHSKSSKLHLLGKK